MFSICAENGSASESRRSVRAARSWMQRRSAGDARRRAKLLDAGARRRKRIERDIDAVEVAEVLAAVLQVIDDLQCGAERIVRRPGGAALAMHIEHEAADRHRRVAAIMNEIVPVRVAQLGHVHAERGEQILRVARRKPALGERVAQPHGFAIVAALAEQVCSRRSSCASFSSAFSSA